MTIPKGHDHFTARFPEQMRWLRLPFVTTCLSYVMCDTAYSRRRTNQSNVREREVTVSVSAPLMLTIGEIARRLGEPVHRIEYVIRARLICPIGRAGNARVFAEEALEAIATELERIGATKAREHD